MERETTQKDLDNWKKHRERQQKLADPNCLDCGGTGITDVGEAWGGGLTEDCKCTKLRENKL